MANPHELSGGAPESPYEQDLWISNQRIALWAAQHRAEAFRKEVLALHKHAGLINIEALEAAVDREAKEASDAALAKREAGLMNDEKSKKPGIFVTGRMDYQAFAEMEEKFRIYQVPYSLDIIDKTDPFAPYALYLPEGAFKCQIEEGLLDQYHLSVYGSVEFEADGEDFQPIGGGAHFLTGGYLQDQSHVHGTITRIEGAGGRLWQNPKVSTDGTPKQRVNQAA
jgi:hypothetical protein